MFDAILNYRYVWDTLDIILVAFIIYYVLGLLEGTRALQVLFGFVLLIVLYYVSQRGLFTLNWILGQFLGSIIIIVVIIFQNDIRRGLHVLDRLRELPVFARRSRRALVGADRRRGRRRAVHRQAHRRERVGRRIGVTLGHRRGAAEAQQQQPRTMDRRGGGADGKQSGVSSR